MIQEHGRFYQAFYSTEFVVVNQNYDIVVTCVSLEESRSYETLNVTSPEGLHVCGDASNTFDITLCNPEMKEIRNLLKN